MYSVTANTKQALLYLFGLLGRCRRYVLWWVPF